MDPKKKLKNRRKVNIKKNLNPVEELSNEESEESKNIAKANNIKVEKEKEKEKDNEPKDEGYDIVIPETTRKNDLRARIEAIKEKRNRSVRKGWAWSAENYKLLVALASKANQWAPKTSLSQKQSPLCPPKTRTASATSHPCRTAAKKRTTWRALIPPNSIA